MQATSHRIFGTLGRVLLIATLASTSSAFADCLVQVASGHSHPPGDPAWVGHTEQDLVAGLGPPSFKLGKPYWIAGTPDYLIDVYTEPQPARTGCVDAYKLNTCGVILDLFCR